MTVPAVFETCRPRDDVLAGSIAEADFAADLAQVVTGKAGSAYLDPAAFFANTYPTRGLKNLLANVCRRLSGAGGEGGGDLPPRHLLRRRQDPRADRFGPCRAGHERCAA